jgi:WD40 repeat protein
LLFDSFTYSYIIMNQKPGFIFPKSGYSNEQFVIRLNQPLQEHTIEISNSEGIIKTFHVKGQSHLILDQLIEPGTYRIKFITGLHSYKESFNVKDAIRLGTSIIKQTYPLVNSSLLLIVMKDRTIFFDEKEKYFFEENDLSPSEVFELKDGRLLFMTHIGKEKEITNYAIYSLADHSIEHQLLNDYSHLGYNSDSNTLLVDNKKTKVITAINIAGTGREGISMRLEKEYESYSFEEDNDAIVIRHHDECYYYNLISGKSARVILTPDICLDLRGKTVYTIKGNSLTYAKLFEQGINWLQELPADFVLSDEKYYHVGSLFPKEVPNETYRELKEKVLAEHRPDQSWTGYYQSIPLPEDILAQKFVRKDHSLFRSGNTLLISENEHETRISQMIFNKTPQNGWLGQVCSKTVSRYNLCSYYFKKVNLIKQSAFPFKQVANLNNWLVIRHTSDLFIFENDKKIGTGYAMDYRDINIKVFGEHAYLILKSTDTYTIYQLTNEVKQIVNRVSVANWQTVDAYGKVFYKIIKNTRTQETYLECFDLKKADSLRIKDDSYWQQRWSWGQRISFGPQYIHIENGRPISIETLKINNPIIGTIQAVSKNLEKVVCLRGKDLLLAIMQPADGSYIYTEIALPAIKYSESYMAPNGNYLVLQKDYNKYILYDVESGEEQHYFSGKFVAFNPDGNMVVEDDTTRKAAVYDPATFREITPANYHHYQFSSPDGSLYADLAKSIKYYHRLRNCYINQEEFRKINLDFGSQLSNYQVAQKATHNKNREQFYLQHQVSLNKMGINSATAVCAENLVRIESFIHIGVSGTNINIEVNFPGDLKYYNYAAFSEDNQYFGYVGKPHVKGHITIYKINYDKVNQKLSLVKHYNSHYPFHASWVCAFSKNNLFATYDSNPHTYLIAVNELFDDEMTDEEMHTTGFDKVRNSVFSKFKSWRMINNKSFVCFSPTGKYLALSEQGYDPLTLGGYGHSDSCALHVADSNSGEILHSFLDHGDTLRGFKQNKLVFAAFSADEKKLMSLSSDGVILVRKLKEKAKDTTKGKISVEAALAAFKGALQGT